jgi:hypothetical protein
MLREFIKQAGKTKSGIASHIGVHRSTVGRWLSDESAMPYWAVVHVLDYLGYDMLVVEREKSALSSDSTEKTLLESDNVGENTESPYSLGVEEGVKGGNGREKGEKRGGYMVLDRNKASRGPKIAGVVKAKTALSSDSTEKTLLGRE